jgi:diacylglycerol kinase
LGGEGAGVLYKYFVTINFIAIALVWIAEFLNTALEAVVDLASKENHPLARVGKDMGASVVLIAALTAIVIGLLVLGPPLLDRIREIEIFY